MSLKDAIASILGAQPGPAAIRRVIEESHHLAIAYLKTKVRHGSLQARHFGLSLEDLALDCLADLFQRDEHGRFVQLIEYFESVKWQNKDAAGLRIALRRLVFSQINEGLFRRHRGHDPELARIIRNLKNAAKASDSLTLVRRGRELWMAMDDERPLRTNPLVPFEILEAHLAAHLHPAIQMPEVVAAFQTLAEALPDYARGYPVSRLALAVRSAHMRLATAASLVPDSSALPFNEDEVQQAIQQVTDEAYKSMYGTYVTSGKMTERMFKAYIQAARDILRAQFCDSARPLDSYYDALILHNQDISKKDYRGQHRHVLEYLVKTSREWLVDRLREKTLDAV